MTTRRSMVIGRVQEGGDVILNDIEIRVTETGADLWFGSFEVPPGATIREGAHYWIVLADGRSGEVAIENTERTGGTPSRPRASAGFAGVGPLRKHAVMRRTRIEAPRAGQ
jgi:hypothetical protein